MAVGVISGDTCPEPYHIAHAEIFCENLFVILALHSRIALLHFA